MRDRLRPFVAAVLAVVLPGLGHLLLKQWGRALVWHVTIVGGTIALYTLYDVEPVDPIGTPTEIMASVPTEVSLPVAFLVILSAVDAYLVGRDLVTTDRRMEARTNATQHGATGDASTSNETGRVVTGVDVAEVDDDGTVRSVNCPSCGRETDAEITFCHWCTEPLPWATESEQAE